MRLVGRLEGILLDPVYSLKAMAGLIDHARTGQIPVDQNVGSSTQGGRLHSLRSRTQSVWAHCLTADTHAFCDRHLHVIS